MKTKSIKLSLIDSNTGQVPGLPANPRLIKDERFNVLVQSLRSLPAMMELRELIVLPHGGRFVTIAGNMRLEGCRQLQWKDAPCKVLDAGTPVEVLREIAIKDNVAYGHDNWAALNTEWDAELLKGWGMEFPEFKQIDEAPAKTNSSHQKQIRLSYSEEQCEIIKAQLSKVAETPELAVWKLLGNK